MAKQKQLKITQRRSVVGQKKSQRATMQALGFRRNYRTIVKNDSPAIRGMIKKVQHLIEVEEV